MMRDLQKTTDLQSQCVQMQTLYYNRAARSALLAVTKPLYVSAASAMVAAVQFFCGEHISSISITRDRALGNQGPQDAAEFAVLSGDPDLGTDLRRLNGRPNDPAFDEFWDMARSILEEYKRCDDRRHGECQPAWSTPPVLPPF